MIGPGGVEVRVVDGNQNEFTATSAEKVETEIETAGPLRTVVALKGKCSMGRKTFLNFRLRFEFFAGIEGFSIAYTFHNLERGRDFFDVRSIELELRLAGAGKPQHTVYQQSYGLFSTLGRVVLSDRGVPKAQSHGIVASAQLRDVWRARLPQQAYARANFFDQSRVLPYQPNDNPRFEQWLARMSTGLNSVATFFDLGDTPDSGYRTTYIPIGNRIRRVRGEDGGKRYFSSGYHFPATHLNNLDDFEPVWVNNEYDVIFALGTEFLRSGEEFRTPVHEGKPFAMVYRTFINFLKAASELGYLKEYDFKH